ATQALESPDESQRRAATWTHATQLRLHLTFNQLYSGTLHIYALDWDSVDRRETVTVDDGTGPQSVILSTAFNNGAWLHFPISVPAGGQVTVTADLMGGANTVLSGIFLGEDQPQPPSAPTAPQSLTATASPSQVSLTWTAPAS